VLNKKGLPHRDKPFSEYLIKSEHSLATHGHSMMMVVVEAVADRFHFCFAVAKKSNCCIISK
jgi:hypothetical protein